MGRRWLYRTPDPGGELTTKDKIYLATIAISSIVLLSTIVYLILKIIRM